MGAHVDINAARPMNRCQTDIYKEIKHGDAAPASYSAARASGHGLSEWGCEGRATHPTFSLYVRLASCNRSSNTC